MGLALYLDILLAVLLAVTIVYAIMLNRRLGALRRDRSELEKLAASFTEATARADASVGNLTKSAKDLQARIEQARSLADDLSFLTDRGEKTADRLEGAVRAGRQRAPIDAAEVARDARDAMVGQPTSHPAPHAAPHPAAHPASQFDGVARPSAAGGASAHAAPRGQGLAPPRNPVEPRDELDDLPSALQAGLRASRDDEDAQDARSQAERELLKALRSAG